MDKDELFDKLECAPDIVWWSWNQQCIMNLRFVESSVEWQTRNQHQEDTTKEDETVCQ